MMTDDHPQSCTCVCVCVFVCLWGGMKPTPGFVGADQ